MVEFSADAARTWLGLLSTLGVEHGAAAVTPAKINARQSISSFSCLRKYQHSFIYHPCSFQISRKKYLLH